MPDEIEVPLEKTQDDILELHKERHGEGHGAHPSAPHGEKPDEKDDWTKYIGLTTAILAVVAAVGALQSGLLINEALLHKNEQVGALTKASDQWNYYQAEGLKGLIYTTAAQGLSPSAPAAKDDLKQAEWYQGKQAEIRKEAEALEAEAKVADKASGALLEKHHVFAYSVSLCQIAIALSAIAALTKRRRVWLLGSAVGLAAAGLLAYGFLR